MATSRLREIIRTHYIKTTLHTFVQARFMHFITQRDHEQDAWTWLTMEQHSIMTSRLSSCAARDDYCTFAQPLPSTDTITPMRHTWKHNLQEAQCLIQDREIPSFYDCLRVLPCNTTSISGRLGGVGQPDMIVASTSRQLRRCISISTSLHHFGDILRSSLCLAMLIWSREWSLRVLLD